MRKINKQVNRRPIMKAIIRRMNSLSTQFLLPFQHSYSRLADNRLAYHDNAESSSSFRGFRGLATDIAIAIPELRIDTNQTTCQSADRANPDATSHTTPKIATISVDASTNENDCRICSSSTSVFTSTSLTSASLSPNPSLHPRMPR